MGIPGGLWEPLMGQAQQKGLLEELWSIWDNMVWGRGSPGSSAPSPYGLHRAVPFSVSQHSHEEGRPQWGPMGPQELPATLLKAFGKLYFAPANKNGSVCLGMEFHSTHPSTHPSNHPLTHSCDKYVAHKPLTCSCPSKAPISSWSPMRENKWVISKCSLFGRQNLSSGGF